MKFAYQLARIDAYTPIDMRAPGAASDSFTLECALDELAYKAGRDPVEFRRRNYAERDQNKGKPFSSKNLRDCYRHGAAKFGREKRNPVPRSMREGNMLIGWGMAGGVWETAQEKAAARTSITADGRLTVSSTNTGTYTIMTQIAAQTLGLPLETVTFVLGDTTLPEGPVQGGSKTTASVGSAVKATCD